jgi:AcrR family transcriptional regulator
MATGSSQQQRRTQAERSATTRAALLDATVASLVEVGYANTTTTGIAERAGVSRGAQMHHFPAKADLVAHAVEHLAEKRIELLRSGVDCLDGRDDRIGGALDLLWDSHRGPLFRATLELWIAARTDDDLRVKLAPVERRVVASLYECSRELFGDELASRRGFERSLGLSLTLIQGLALMDTHQIDPPAHDLLWARYRDELTEMFRRLPA